MSFSGLLWTVREQKTFAGDTELSCDGWINCDLLEYWQETKNNPSPGWHNKPLDETARQHNPAATRAPWATWPWYPRMSIRIP